MARLSKTHQITIFEDTRIPTPDDTEHVPLGVAQGVENETDIATEQLQDVFEAKLTKNEDNESYLEIVQEQELGEDDADDERRESIFTTASISSFPESAYQTDNDLPDLHYGLDALQGVRLMFPKINDSQRMKVTGTPRFRARSPRHSRSRTGTPKSLRSANAKGSPRSKRRISEATEAPEEDEDKHYPLVLLHATLLPIDLAWSAKSMREVLPAHVQENIQLLRSKISETVLSRGILIPHPRQEYELLEEKLLEALELVEERVTKDGHFHSRHSSSSESDNGGDSDSGVGSSTVSSDGEVCTTCRHRIKTAGKAVGMGSRKWSIRVFAANGLMRPSAWAAAWSDMESVDVEILPWMDEELRRKLDEIKEQEEADEAALRQEEEDERIRRIVEEQVLLALEEQKSHEEAERSNAQPEFPTQLEHARVTDDTTREDEPLPNLEHASHRSYSNEKPQVYRPSEIPLSILLKNYIYLLATDWRNVPIFLLCLSGLWLALTQGSPRSYSLTLPDDASLHLESSLSLPMVATSDILQVVNWSDEVSTNDSAQETLSAVSTAPQTAYLQGLRMDQEICVVDSKDRYFSVGRHDDTCPANFGKTD